MTVAVVWSVHAVHSTRINKSTTIRLNEHRTRNELSLDATYVYDRKRELDPPHSSFEERSQEHSPKELNTTTTTHVTMRMRNGSALSKGKQ